MSGPSISEGKEVCGLCEISETTDEERKTATIDRKERSLA